MTFHLVKFEAEPKPTDTSYLVWVDEQGNEWYTYTMRHGDFRWSKPQINSGFSIMKQFQEELKWTSKKR